jgi:hypothetical protein
MLALLEKLDGVRPTGPNRWLARCAGPNHENGDRHPSLSVRLVEGDRWLLYCFAGCQPLDICNALDIMLGDLFHDGRAKRDYPDGKDRTGRHVPRVRPADFLEQLNHEAGVVAFIAADMIAHPLRVEDETWDRLAEAYRRIAALRAECMAYDTASSVEKRVAMRVGG